MTKNESKAVILARVSSKSQEDEGYSLDSQLKLLNGYCENKSLHVVKVFKIAETASKEHSRKIFNELMTYLKQGKIFHLAVEKTDRLTRNFSDAVAIDKWLEKDERRRLHAVKENLLLHKEAKSDVKFMWNIHLSVAKKYSDNLREEAMKGWAEKLAQGWLPAVPPIGYITVTEEGKRIHVPDPKTRHLVKKAFEFYLKPNQSVKTTAEEMRIMGLTTRKGRPYYKSQVYRILSNPFYIGINRFNGQDYPGAQEPIIPKRLFEEVQDKLTCKTKGKYKKHNPVLKGLIACSNCTKTVTWQLQKGRYYGACSRRPDGCRSPLLRQDRIEADIEEMLERLVSPSQEVIEWVAEAMEKRHKEEIASSNQLKESIEYQIDRLKRMLGNLYEDKLAGDITADMYKEKRAEFDKQIEVLESKLSDTDSTLGKRLEQKLVLLELSQKAAKLYKKKGADDKRLIISKLFKDITYKDGAISVKYTNFARAIADNVLETHKVLGGKI